MLPAPRMSDPAAPDVPVARGSSLTAPSASTVPPAGRSGSGVPMWRDFTVPGCW
jgi:hypothetical protein